MYDKLDPRLCVCCNIHDNTRGVMAEFLVRTGREATPVILNKLFADYWEARDYASEWLKQHPSPLCYARVGINLDPTDDVVS
jgi:hypothetical protein